MHKELYFLPTINMKKIITFISMSDPKYVILVIADLQTKDLIGRENLVLTTERFSLHINLSSMPANGTAKEEL